MKRTQKPRGQLHCTISVERLPEVLAAMRHEFARIVRDVAQDEPPRVGRRLRQIADAFEAGSLPEGLL